MKYVLSITIIIIGLLFSEAVSANDDKSFAEIVLSRGKPDPITLVKYASPDMSGQKTTDAFYDILKIRDDGDRDFVEPLTEILDKHNGLTRIHGYAAAQALYSIGTRHAHNALVKNILDESYNAALGIDYTFHWKMDSGKRDLFIKDYHLKNLSDDIELALAVTPHSLDKDRYDITITLKNISEEQYVIRDPSAYIGKMLYFSDEVDQFYRSFKTVEYDMPPPRYVKVNPGEQFQYNVALFTKKGNKWFFHTDDVGYTIISPGTFKIYAMLEQQSPPQPVLKYLKFDNPWIGRAVSEPAIISLHKIITKSEELYENLEDADRIWGNDGLNSTIAKIYGRSELHYAAVTGDIFTIKRTLVAGAKIDGKDKGGFTPLMLAASNNKPGAVKLLLDDGADASIRNNKGQTALDIAHKKRFERVIKTLNKKL